jgi:DUF4097 and DUF4098 domain-containing protein YvlB
MKKLLLLVAICWFTGVSAQDWNESTPYLSKSLTEAAIQKIHIETSGGNITVEGVESGARMEVFINYNNNRGSKFTAAELQNKLQQEYEFKIETNNNQLTAIAKPISRNGNWWKNGLTISFRIYAPKTVASRLSTSGGNIVLKNLSSGDQDFTTSGGNLVIEHTGGKLSGVTSGGNIEVKYAGNDMDLSTSGGNIKAEQCKGKMRLTTSGGNLSLNALQGDINATTSGGDVRGENITGDLSAHTSGGDIDLRQLSGALESSTSGGDISVAFSALGKFVKINNSGGNISLLMPAGSGIKMNLRADHISTSTLTNFQGDVEDHQVKGTINGGGVPVDVYTSSGRINLTLK